MLYLLCEVITLPSWYILWYWILTPHHDILLPILVSSSCSPIRFYHSLAASADQKYHHGNTTCLGKVAIFIFKWPQLNFGNVLKLGRSLGSNRSSKLGTNTTLMKVWTSWVFGLAFCVLKLILWIAQLNDILLDKVHKVSVTWHHSCSILISFHLVCEVFSGNAQNFYRIIE